VTRVVNPDKPEEELHVAGPGEVLGEMALLDDLPRSANVTAVDDVTVLLLPIWEFRTTLRNHPEIAFKLLATLSHRIRRLEESHSSNH
jgi:CRP/FNR family transcriptional regulator